MSGNKSKIHWLSGLFVLLSFAAFVFTIFGGFNFPYAQEYAGSPGSELEGWIWRYWWAKKMVSTAFYCGASFRYLFWLISVAGSYPETGNLFDLFVFSWPLETIFGAPLYFNVKVFLIFLLNGCCGYLLGYSFFKNRAAAWLSGAIFIFSPYCLVELSSGRIRQTIIFPMILYCLSLVKLYRRPSLLWLVSTGFWGGFSTLIYLFYGQSLLIFTVIYLVWNLVSKTEGQFTKQRFYYLVGACLLTIIIAAPSGLSYAATLFRGNSLPELVLFTDFPPLNVLISPQSERILQQNDPLLTSFQRFRFDSLPWQYPFSLSFSRCLPLMVTLLSLAACPLLWWAQYWFELKSSVIVKPEEAANPDEASAEQETVKQKAAANIDAQADEEPFSCLTAVPWVISLGLFYSLTLGPYLLDINSGDYVNKLGGGIGTPYLIFFKYLPAFARLFSPVRMSAMLLIAASVLCGAAVSALYRFHKRALVNWLIAITAVGIIGYETFYCQAAPLSSFSIYHPACYSRLAKKPGLFIVAEVPIRTGDYLQYYQILHGKRLMFGWADAAIPPKFPKSDLQLFTRTITNLAENSFLKFIEQLNVDPSADIIFDYNDYKTLVNEGLLYIIVHERSCWQIDPVYGKEFYERYCDTMERLFGPPCDQGTEKTMEMNKHQSYEYSISIYRIDKLKIP
ncbi:MAG: hypothetical protein ACI376_08965 [Candidatus Bruticola sp.]